MKAQEEANEAVDCEAGVGSSASDVELHVRSPNVSLNQEEETV